MSERISKKQCTADRGVEGLPGGEARAIRCDEVAVCEVDYNGVKQLLCSEHAHSFLRSRPDAVAEELR